MYLGEGSETTGPEKNFFFPIYGLTYGENSNPMSPL